MSKSTAGSLRARDESVEDESSTVCVCESELLNVKCARVCSSWVHMYIRLEHGDCDILVEKINETSWFVPAA